MPRKTGCNVGRIRQADKVRPDDHSRKPRRLHDRSNRQDRPLTHRAILLPAPGSGRSIGEAATAAPNKNQFNGVGGLQAYLTLTRIGDQSSG
jgi:hypothetical protein